MFSSNNPLRVFTAFSGYDSQCLALERLKEEIPGFDYVLVGWSEIDAMAIKAHNALFPAAESLNFGDISKINWGGKTYQTSTCLPIHSLVRTSATQAFKKDSRRGRAQGLRSFGSAQGQSRRNAQNTS